MPESRDVKKSGDAQTSAKPTTKVIEELRRLGIAVRVVAPGGGWVIAGGRPPKKGS